MISGNLRYWIDILSPQTVKDEFGAEQETFVLFTNLRAEKKEISGNYMLDNKEIFHSNRVDWTIYYRKNLTDKMRVKFDGKEYRILYIREIPFRQGMILETELINN
jgi:phage head-tail adaptor, putative, SPP1 family